MEAEALYPEGIERRAKKSFHIKALQGFGDTQIGPIYLGIWGLLAIGSFAITVLMIFIGYGLQVGWNPIRFMREFAVLGVEPPAPSYGLQFAPLAQGGFWQIATLFLTLTLVFWTIRIWSRATANGVRPLLPIAFGAALFLFSAIYIIHPISMGSWNEAPGHGLRAQLVWANNFSIKYGNFYYNPFHMVSIFGLLGSTVLLAMHGATILATVQYQSHRELDEIEDSTEGTHRAQLIWRWIMGFNATPHSIHVWALGLATLAAVAGGIGVITSGPAEPNWYLWACRAGITPGGIAACVPLP